MQAPRCVRRSSHGGGPLILLAHHAQEYEPPSGALEQAIEADWGALDALVAQFNAKAAGVQGRRGRGRCGVEVWLAAE